MKDDWIAPPDPDELQNLIFEAEQEPDEVDIAEYGEVISILRDKGFSWRRVADWLKKRGVPVTHNQLYYYAARQKENEAMDPDYKSPQEMLEELED